MMKAKSTKRERRTRHSRAEHSTAEQVLGARAAAVAMDIAGAKERREQRLPTGNLAALCPPQPDAHCQPKSVIKPNDSIKMRFVPFMRKSICFHVVSVVCSCALLTFCATRSGSTSAGEGNGRRSIALQLSPALES